MKLKIIFEKLLNNIPWRLKQIIKLIITIQNEHPYPSSDFPLIGEKKAFKIRSSYLDRVLKFENDLFDYYSNIYDDPREIDTDIAERDVARTSIEILPGRVLNKKNFFIKNKSIFHIAKPKFSPIHFRILNDKEETTFKLSCIRNRFLSFFEEDCTNIELKSKENFFVSQPIPIEQKIKNKKSLVIFIFVDGLVDRSVLGIKNLQDYMPHTAKFFKGGFDFRNHHVNAEWTLPSFASIFSGQYSQTHKLFDPHAIHEIGKSFDILSQYFKRNNYVTFSAGGNPRISPSHGYVKGFDRTVYRSFMPAQEVISNFLEHSLVFKKRDQFCFLQFNDIHHNLAKVPDYSVMSQLRSHVVAYEADPLMGRTRNKWIPKSNNKKRVYLERIKRLDNYLKIIYEHIEQNYDSSEVCVCLTSDHGQSFLTDDEHWLSSARTKAIWLLKTSNQGNDFVNEYTEGVDIFNTILSECGIDFDINVDGMLPSCFGGSKSRNYTFSQSIYPGQTYKAVINADHGRYIYETSKPIVRVEDILSDEFAVQILQNNDNSFTKQKVREIVVEKFS